MNQYLRLVLEGRLEGRYEQLTIEPDEEDAERVRLSLGDTRTSIDLDELERAIKKLRIVLSVDRPAER